MPSPVPAATVRLRDDLIDLLADQLQALVLDPDVPLRRRDVMIVSRLTDILDELIEAASTSNAGFARKDLQPLARKQLDRIAHLQGVLEAMAPPAPA